MGTLYAMSLGPMPTAEGHVTMILGLLDGRLLASPATSDSDAALAALRDRVPAGTRLECLPELAPAGARHGYSAGAPSNEVLGIRAQLAVVLAHPQLSPRASGELYPLIKAAAAFWAARPWERLPADAPIEVVVTGAVRGRYEAAVMGAAGEEFGLALYSRPGSIATISAALDARRLELAAGVESLSLTYDEEPGFAARAIEAWCGLPMVPITFGMRRGKPRPIESGDALALAVSLLAMSGMKGVPGEEASETLSGGDVEVAVTVRLPALAPTPPRRAARSRRPRR